MWTQTRRLTALTVFFAGVSTFLMGMAEKKDHSHHPPANLERYIQRLEDPGRATWQKPEEVIAALALKEEEAIVDVGAGSGYFSLQFARMIGKGKVLAVDINPGMLTYLEEKAKENDLKNIQTILAEPDDPKLPPSSADLIFLCNVAHHINNRPAYYQKLKNALKPNGRMAIVDFYKKELPVGPPIGMKLSRQQVLEEAKESGYKLLQEFDFLPYQYFLVFQPVAHP